MYETVKALVLREVRYKESDKILTLLTDTGGKMTVRARGALRKGSKIAAACQQLCYAELTLFGNRERYTVQEAMILEEFAGLRTDLTRFALGCYIAEIAESMSVEDSPDLPLLQLTLNALYALSRERYSEAHIKSSFELRMMSLCGYEPNLEACCVCGAEEPEVPMFLLDGEICCRKCRSSAVSEQMELTPSALQAMRFVFDAPPKQFMAYSLDEAGEKILAGIAERYLLRSAERNFSTLDYWKKVRTKL